MTFDPRITTLQLGSTENTDSGEHNMSGWLQQTAIPTPYATIQQFHLHSCMATAEPTLSCAADAEFYREVRHDDNNRQHQSCPGSRGVHCRHRRIIVSVCHSSVKEVLRILCTKLVTSVKRDMLAKKLAPCLRAVTSRLKWCWLGLISLLQSTCACVKGTTTTTTRPTSNKW